MRDDRPLTATPVRLRYADAIEVARRLVHRTAPSKGWPEHRQEDLVGAVMEKYTARWGRDSAPDNVEAWLTRVIHNAALDMCRHDAAHPEDLADTTAEEALTLFDAAATASRQPSLGTEVVNQDLLETILGLVNPNQQPFVEMKYLDNLTAIQIADRLGMTPQAAGQAVHRAKHALATALAARPDLVTELRGTARSHSTETR